VGPVLYGTFDDQRGEEEMASECKGERAARSGSRRTASMFFGYHMRHAFPLPQPHISHVALKKIKPRRLARETVPRFKEFAEAGGAGGGGRDHQ
jgi:hypothetical protein